MDRNDKWKQNLLQNLEGTGSVGQHAAAFIRDNQVVLHTVDNEATNLWWKMQPSLRGPRIKGAIYLSRALREKPVDSPWLLASIVHEVKHLEQGFWTAFSVYGELEAWQHGFFFYQDQLARPIQNQFIIDLLALPLSHDQAILKEARTLINQYENDGTSLW